MTTRRSKPFHSRALTTGCVPAVDKVFSNPLILDTIFQYLDLKDLKSCCFVNTTWDKTASSEVFRNSCVRIHVLPNVPRPQQRNLEVNVPLYEKPCVENLSINVDDKSFNVRKIKKFLETQAQRLRGLDYVLQTTSYKQRRMFTTILPRFTNLRELTLTLVFPKKMSKLPLFVLTGAEPIRTLTELVLRVDISSSQDKDEAFWALDSSYDNIVQNVRALFNIAPNVTSLALVHGRNSPAFKKFVHAILYDQSVQPKWKITQLELADNIDVKQFSQLIFDPPLKKFVFSIIPSTETKAVNYLEQILVKLAQNLELLYIHTVWDGEGEVADLQFPVMPQLRYLALEEVKFGNKPHYRPKFFDENGEGKLNYSRHFPVLQNLQLKFGVENLEEIYKSLRIFVPANPTESAICTTLKNFTLFVKEPRHFENFQGDFVKAFPNLGNKKCSF